MYPVLFHLGPLTAYSYGALILAGLLGGIAAGWIELRRLGLPPDWAVDVALLGLGAGLLGGKVVYLATLPLAELEASPWRHLSPGSGLVFYGVFAGAVLSTWAYARVRRVPALRLMDVAAPGLALGYGLGRVGCFLAGCCWGRPSSLPWAVAFEHPLSPAPRGVPLHPVQLYSALHGLAVFAVLWWLRPRRRHDGELVVAFCALYAVGRFVTELYRGDALRGEVAGLSTSQFLSLVAFAAGTLLLALLRRRGGEGSRP